MVYFMDHLLPISSLLAPFFLLLSPPKHTDYTGCRFQFYIICPLLALITLINQTDPLEMMENLEFKRKDGNREGGEEMESIKNSLLNIGSQSQVVSNFLSQL